MIAVETITVEMIIVERIAVERINSQLKLLHEKAIASCVDPGGGWKLTPSRHSVRCTGWPLVLIKFVYQG